MATNNMHNIATLIKRLEAATSRLEDIASTVAAPDGTAATATPQGNGVNTPVVIPATPSPRAGTPNANAPTQLPKEIQDFDAIISNDLANFIKLSNLDPILVEQAKLLKECFDSERSILLLSTKAKKPVEGTQEYMEVYKDIQSKMIAVNEVRENNRASPFKDHLALVADGTQTLGWIVVDSKPADQAAELFGGAQMFGNKLLRLHKDKDQAQVDWVNAFYKVMKGLVAFIKTYYHPQGVKWNSDGVSVQEGLKEVRAGPSSAPPAPSGGGPPPPPPPPPPAQLMAAKSPPAKAKGGDMGAIFQQLNQGENITSGLKKVDPSQQTHKNPNLRGSAPVVARSNSQGSNKSIPPSTKPKPESMRTKKPPRKELDANKWIIENYDSPSSTVEIHAERNHSILISRCKKTTIRVIGKANAISVDNSVGTSIILDSLVSSIDVIKCPNFALQILETVPTVLLDQVDGATLYLSKDSMHTEVLSSKCSAVNVYLPPKNEEVDDYQECSVPEQFRSYIKDGKLITEIVEHSG